MNTFANLTYHLIFQTLDGVPLLTPSHEPELCRYVNGIVNNRRISSKQLNDNSNRRGWFRWGPGYGWTPATPIARSTKSRLGPRWKSSYRQVPERSCDDSRTSG